MSKFGKFLNHINEEPPSDYDRKLGKALGISMPNDWDEKSDYEKTLEVLQTKTFMVSKTFAVTSEASVEAGDYEETGFTFQDELMDFEDVMRELGTGYKHPSIYPLTPKNAANSYISTELDTLSFEDDTDIEYSLFIKNENNTDLSGPELYTLYKAAGCLK